jgi:hypothetical protein
MENIRELFIEMPNGETETHILIDRGNGEFTGMTKAHYDAMQAEQSTPSVIDEA